MKDLNALFYQCLEEVHNAGIITGNIVNITINTRAKARFGQCKYNSARKTYSINISNEILKDDVSDESTKDTIIHEILHTCKNAMNHKAEWKKLAEIMNNTYGYNIKRTSSYEEKGVNRPATRENKYALICENCGKTYYYKRWSKPLANPSKYRCGVCHKSQLKVKNLTDNCSIYSIHSY